MHRQAKYKNLILYMFCTGIDMKGVKINGGRKSN